MDPLQPPPAPRTAAGNGDRPGSDGPVADRHVPGHAAHPRRQSQERNQLLRAVPAEEYARLAPHLRTVSVRAGTVVYAPNAPMTQVHFPHSAVHSVVQHMADGDGVEVGTVGHEGMSGLSLFLDAGSTPNETIVQIEGEVRSMPAAAFVDAVEELPGLQRTLRRYTHAYLMQVSQTAACNRMHGLERRCARWLLLTHDRVGADSFNLTHEFLAFMLGVRRAGVTEAAGALQRDGIIRYQRGHVTIVDREGLERASCECYGVVHRHFARLESTLGPIPPG